ncbi:MAG: helix-turn-helix domain-containing protein, partial [Halobacteria archaeon]
MSELTKYGLSLEEAKVYFTLVKIGASKASTLAASVGFDRVKTYRILQKLVEEKIVDVSLSKPMLFSAHPPQEVLNNLVQQMKNRVKLAEDGLKALLSEWSRLPILTPQMQQPRFRIIQGRVQIYSQIVDMLGKGVREALLLTQGDDLVWLRLGGVQDALVEASKRGVQVRLLTDFDDRLIDVVREYSEGLVVRCARVPSLFRLFILDGCEVIVSTFPLPPSRLDEEGDVGLWTDSLPFASGLLVFFNALWEEALDAQMKIRSLVSGIQPEELKVLRRFDEAKIIVNRMIAYASYEIFSLFNIPEQLILPDGVWQIYPVLADKGVNLKLLTTLNLDNLDEVSPLLNAAEV